MGMKYMRWTLAFAMICGASYASQALAASVTLADGDALDLDDRTKSYIFSSQADDAPARAAMNAPRLNNTGSPDRTTIMVTQDSASGKLLTITVTWLQTFPIREDDDYPLIASDYTAEPSDMKNWNYFVQSGGANSAAGAAVEVKDNGQGGVNQVIDSLDSPQDVMDVVYADPSEDISGTNQEGERRAHRVKGLTAKEIARIGMAALTGNTTVTVRTETSATGAPIKYDFVNTSVSVSSSGNLTIGNNFFADADHPMLRVKDKYDDEDEEEVKKPEMSTVVLVGVGAITAMMVLGMGLAGLARRKG